MNRKVFGLLTTMYDHLHHYLVAENSVAAVDYYGQSVGLFVSHHGVLVAYFDLYGSPILKRTMTIINFKV